jgi:transcriptional regulator with GAF, ATPase, and Fis domain
VQTLRVDLRVVAATNRDLKQAVAQREFREDLYFRLSVMPIEIPPLRRRRGDILPLAEAFLDRYAREMGRRPMKLSDEARAALAEHRWPGNVRELQNCLERAVILCDGSSIGAEHLRLGPSEGGPSVSDLIDLRQPLEQVSSRAAAMAEQEAIRLALGECPDRAAAAERLGLTPAALTRRIKALGLGEG